MMDDNKNKPVETNDESANPDKLRNIDIQLNAFGDIIKDVNIDAINKFLDENVDDRKLGNDKD